MPFIIQGVRPGSGVYVADRGILINGQLDDDAAARLRANGMPIVEHTWIPPITDEDWFQRASDQEKAERAAADLMLGRMPNAEGTTRTERDIAAAYDRALLPMRKSSLLAKMRQAFKRNW